MSSPGPDADGLKVWLFVHHGTVPLKILLIIVLMIWENKHLKLTYFIWKKSGTFIQAESIPKLKLCVIFSWKSTASLHYTELFYEKTNVSREKNKNKLL